MTAEPAERVDYAPYGDYESDCPARMGVDLFGNSWLPVIVYMLRDGPLRHSDLRTAVGGITQKMLTKTLRDLERDGLVRRAVYPTVPPRVEYTITALGADLGRISHAMGTWVVEHQHEITAARAEFDAAQAIEPAPLPRLGTVH
ncbi:winged helix-turn-helix transcriptional regulator [Gordonia aichiensis]